MPTPKQITAQYIENISKEVINNFASSYQTYQSSGGTWHQEIEYKPSIEKFVFEKRYISTIICLSMYIKQNVQNAMSTI